MAVAHFYVDGGEEVGRVLKVDGRLERLIGDSGQHVGDVGPLHIPDRNRHIGDSVVGVAQIVHIRELFGSDDRHWDGLDGDDDDAFVQYVVVLDVRTHGQRSGGFAHR